MNIYQPYTYLLKCIPVNRYYYGVRYAKNCNPSDFFVEYFTSSKDVRDLILKYGLESFEFEIRHTFKCAKDARLWESKVLKKINAASRIDFINKSNTSAPSNDEEIRNAILKTFITRYGVDNPSKHPSIVQKIINYWKGLSPEEQKKVNDTRESTCLVKYGKRNVMQLDCVREKGRKTSIERYGKEYAMQSEKTKSKAVNTNLYKLGVSYPMQAESVKEKSRNSCLEKYGVDNPSKSPVVIEKIKSYLTPRTCLSCKIVIKGDQNWTQHMNSKMCKKKQKKEKGA